LLRHRSTTAKFAPTT